MKNMEEIVKMREGMFEYLVIAKKDENFRERVRLYKTHVTFVSQFIVIIMMVCSFFFSFFLHLRPDTPVECQAWTVTLQHH